MVNIQIDNQNIFYFNWKQNSFASMFSRIAYNKKEK